MKFLVSIYNFHRRNCRLTPGSVSVYLLPDIVGLFAPDRVRHPDFAQQALSWGIVLLQLVALGVGVWLTKGIARKVLALVYVIALMILYFAPNSQFNIFAFWLPCLWITSFIDGQSSAKPTRFRGDRE